MGCIERKGRGQKMHLKRRFSQARALTGIINTNGTLLGSDTIDELRITK